MRKLGMIPLVTLTLILMMDQIVVFSKVNIKAFDTIYDIIISL